MKLKDLSFSALLNNDKFVKVLSVCIAVFAWFIIVISVDTTRTTIIEHIPVDFDLTGTTPDANLLSVIEGGEQYVDATIEGAGTVISRLTADDFVATPILSKVTKPGEYELRVEIKKANEKTNDYNVISASPKVKAIFDHVDERTFAIEPVADNVTAEEGFVKQKIVTPHTKITVNGPSSELDKVKKVVLAYDKEQVLSDSINVDGELRFLDENGNPITFKYSTYTDQQFTMFIPIYKTAVVPVKVSFVNVPAGIDINTITYTLSDMMVEISGPKDIVDSYSEIALDPIDFRSLDIGSVFTRDINLYAGLVNVNKVETVTVSFNTDNLDTKTFTTKNIILKNKPANYDIEVVSQTVQGIKIIGDKEDLEKMSSNDLIATIDFSTFNLAEGNSIVPVSITMTGNKYAWAVGDEYNVIINSKKK